MAKGQAAMEFLMTYGWAILVVLVAIGALAYFGVLSPPKSNEEKDCIDTGGTVETTLCCGSATDFPNTCLIGACGCAPTDSHNVKTCNCGEGKCFNGTGCV